MLWQNHPAGRFLTHPVERLDGLENLLVVDLGQELEQAQTRERQRLDWLATKLGVCLEDHLPGGERVIDALPVPDPPAATRRVVHDRACGRCEVPGCSNLLFLHVHHLKWRSRGGGNGPENLSIACAAHHGLIHSNAFELVPHDEPAPHFSPARQLLTEAMSEFSRRNRTGDWSCIQQLHDWARSWALKLEAVA